MSYTASYDCIFVLFSLLGDNFFHYMLECMFHYSFFFKEVENFFFLSFSYAETIALSMQNDREEI